MPKREAASSYEANVTFRAPLRFVYDWCTDYTPQDGRLEKDDYQRRIVRRSRNEVVYEDLSDMKDGWFWTRHVVKLLPPDRWHSDSVGSHRDYTLDYQLKELPGNLTQLTLRARRRPTEIGGKNPSQAAWAANIEKVWREFGRVLERDYKKSRSRRASK
jgi:hypothetical protein